MFGGTPVVGTLLALFVASQSSMDWRAIFLIGGTLPIALVPLLYVMLPESEEFRSARASGAGVADVITASEALFGGGRLIAPLLLWVTYAFTRTEARPGGEGCVGTGRSRW